MEVIVTQGRKKKCKDTIGGIRSFYLATFVKAARSQINYDGASVTEYPQTFVYKFDVAGQSSFIQNPSENEGGKFYNQSLSVTFLKISAYDNLNFSKFLNKEYLCVVEDRNGNFFLLGFKNGVICEKLELSTDGLYTMTFEGQEENLAPFCELLVNDSIIVIDDINYVFQNNDNFIFQNNDNYIWL